MSDLVATRRSLHAVAELLLAGPQHATSGTIRLTPRPGGFATVAAPSVRVEGGLLVHEDRSVQLDGRSVADVAGAAGLEARAPEGLYEEGCGLGADHVLAVDDASAAEIASAFERGAGAMRAFRSGAQPVLWPEHFDLGITIDRVNYGVSPGDDFLDVPYAYVGPWSEFSGAFWNAPFGAARPLAELPDLVGWFAEGATAAAALPPRMPL